MIEILELGGIHEGVSYVPDEETQVDTSDDYLMFLGMGDSGEPYQLLNPSQAAYPKAENGTPEALPSNEMDVATAELIEYVN